MNLDYPYAFDARERTAAATDAGHVRDMIEAVLFTMPGERVNRPDFGSGVMQLVFAPNSVELAATVQFLVQGALQRWLADWIVVDEVGVESAGAALSVTITYTIRRTQERRVDTFVRGATPP